MVCLGRLEFQGTELKLPPGKIRSDRGPWGHGICDEGGTGDKEGTKGPEGTSEFHRQGAGKGEPFIDTGHHKEPDTVVSCFSFNSYY